MFIYLLLTPVIETDLPGMTEAIRHLRTSGDVISLMGLLDAVRNAGIGFHYRHLGSIRNLEPQTVVYGEGTNEQITLNEGPDLTGPTPIVLTFVDGVLV